ncbi:MAG TPA: phenylalanine--tRNA ligase beta subunit-related protein [Draconibacterium sp.]|nr:phenylalanine--tRNA ligase beta subunit-related protein [Draconibacterium sp.]
MNQISISKHLARKVPGIKLSCIACDVEFKQKNEELWNEISEKIATIAAGLKVEQISRIPAIAFSRRAYKACGKDPARYRLSAEALLRRVVKRKELYQVNNVVDLLNLVSITSGFSIGGYDSDKIKGNITFGIGEKVEPFEGIGRGELNIEFLPVFRDGEGAFGSPTSDSLRTSVSEETKRFLMVIIYFGGGELLQATELAIMLLKKYAGAGNIEIKTVTE